MEAALTVDTIGLPREMARVSGGTVGGLVTPSLPSTSESARLLDSVWAPLALRTLGAAALLLGLAGVGIFSVRMNSHGAPLLHAEMAAHGAAGAHAEPATDVGATADADAAAPSLGATASAPAATGHGEAAPLADAEPEPPAAPGITRDGKVILNTANAEELERLPGVGAVRARAILELRTKLKKFRRATDLLRVRGIGRRSLERMLPHLVVDPEPPPTSPAPEAPAKP